MSTSGSAIAPVRVFISYAHEDEDYRAALVKHLSLMKRRNLVSEWHDRKILPGQDWASEISEQLNVSEIILFLVSVDFLASDYCWKVEVARALDRNLAGGARVIPIVLRTVDWSSAPFARLQALPTNALPVTKWPTADDAWTDVARGIEQAIRELRTFASGTQLRRRSYLPTRPPSRPRRSTSLRNRPFLIAAQQRQTSEPGQPWHLYRAPGMSRSPGTATLSGALLYWRELHLHLPP